MTSVEFHHDASCEKTIEWRSYQAVEKYLIRLAISTQGSRGTTNGQTDRIATVQYTVSLGIKYGIQTIFLSSSTARSVEQRELRVTEKHKQTQKWRVATMGIRL